MAGFTADWLDLREPADAAARSAALVRQLNAHFEPAHELAIADLGAGTGASLRWLLPRLTADQHWHLLEADPELIRGTPPRLVAWAGDHGLHTTPSASGLALEGRHQVTCHAVNLARDPLPLRGLGHDRDVHLVTASALLDLVSSDWLDHLARCCARQRSAALLALTFDGRARLDPPHPFDCDVRAALNRHQRRDKGFGPALGPDATAFASGAFQRHGYRVIQARSDWQLAPQQAGLSRCLLEGWRQAASEVLDADAKNALARWHAWHEQALHRGTARVWVGHVDLLALPRQ